MSNTLEEACRCCESGDSDGAEKLCREILDTDPQNAEALHLLGVSFIQRGETHEAIGYLQQAVAIEDTNALFLNHLGVAYASIKQYEQAANCFRQAIQAAPRLADSHFNLGNALRRLQRPSDAVEHYRTALEIVPDSPETHFNLANTFRDLGRFDEAVGSYRRALSIKPVYLKAHANLGNVYQEQKRFDEARDCYQTTLRMKPDYTKAHINLAKLAMHQERFGEAEKHYRKALKIEPELVVAHRGLTKALTEQGKLDEALVYVESLKSTREDGEALLEAQLDLAEKLRIEGRIDDALACARRVLDMKSDMAAAHQALGLALADKGRNEEAAESYRRALEIWPDYPDCHNNLAVVLQYTQSFAESMKHVELGLRLRPDFGVAHLNRSLAWLRKGDYCRGWPEFEWRLKCDDYRITSLSTPAWTGETRPEATILLLAEQGLGDTIQFIRYASMVRQRVGCVIVYCQDAMVPLLRRCPGVDRPVSRKEKIPAHDVRVPMMSLPTIFETTLASIPAEGAYVFADDTLVDRWRESLAAYGGFKVGIAWQGSKKYGGDAYRSLPLRHFAPLARVPGVHLFSIQKGFGAEQLAELPDDFTVIDFGSDLDTTSGPFMDTAAIMKNLDLVITSDTSIPHLAGAMGVPVWVLLSAVPDWRWMMDRHDSPWYPTMRLFRQTRLGHWEELLQHVADELRHVVQGDTARLGPPEVAGLPLPEIPVSPGEMLDKLTILQIKCERISEEAKLDNVRSEYDALCEIRDRAVPSSGQLTALCRQLKTVNEQLWDIEDRIRLCELHKDFGPRFVELARCVYRENDKRSALKRQINLLLGSEILEEKAYPSYE